MRGPTIDAPAVTPLFPQSTATPRAQTARIDQAENSHGPKTAQATDAARRKAHRAHSGMRRSREARTRSRLLTIQISDSDSCKILYFSHAGPCSLLKEPRGPACDPESRKELPRPRFCRSMYLIYPPPCPGQGTVRTPVLAYPTIRDGLESDDADRLHGAAGWCGPDRL